MILVTGRLFSRIYLLFLLLTDPVMFEPVLQNTSTVVLHFAERIMLEFLGSFDAKNLQNDIRIRSWIFLCSVQLINFNITWKSRNLCKV